MANVCVFASDQSLLVQFKQCRAKFRHLVSELEEFMVRKQTRNYVYKHDKSILRLRTTEWGIIRFLAWGVCADVPPLIMEIANYLHALVMDIYLTCILCGTGTLACGYESGVMSLSDNNYNRPIHVG